MTASDPWVRGILRCPLCKGPLTDGADGTDGTDQTGGPNAAAGINGPGTRLECAACALAYPVQDGIPVLLADEAVRLA
jgi:uncharacterized protein YbaR (Trm112 family)